jgi:hypothetical protein
LNREVLVLPHRAPEEGVLELLGPPQGVEGHGIRSDGFTCLRDGFDVDHCPVHIECNSAHVELGHVRSLTALCAGLLRPSSPPVSLSRTAPCKSGGLSRERKRHVPGEKYVMLIDPRQDCADEERNEGGSRDHGHMLHGTSETLTGDPARGLELEPRTPSEGLSALGTVFKAHGSNRLSGCAPTPSRATYR